MNKNEQDDKRAAERNALLRKILRRISDHEALKIARDIANPKPDYPSLDAVSLDVMRLVWADVQDAESVRRKRRG